MGANQSKTPILNEKLVIERLRALEMKDQSDNEDYVHVHEKDVGGSKKQFRAPWTNLSISEVEHWEHELLQDPKNRCFPPFLYIQPFYQSHANILAPLADSHSPPSPPQTRRPFYSQEVPRLKISRSSMSKSPSKAHPSPTNAPAVGAGSSHQQTSSASHS